MEYMERDNDPETFRAAQAGDMEARNYLIEAWQSLVGHAAGRAKKTMPSHVEREDLHSVGTEGLIQAIDRFDPDQGIPFRGYAHHRIMGAIIDYTRSQANGSREQRRRDRAVREAEAVLHQELHRDPTTGEVAEVTGLTVQAIREAEQHVYEAHNLRLNMPVATDEADEYIDLLGDRGSSNPEDTYELTELAERMAEAISGLDRRARVTLYLAYAEGMNDTEIADLYGLSNSRVSQIRVRALERLREDLV